MKHRQYLPLMSRNCTPDTRPQFLSLLRQAETDTVFLVAEPEPFFRPSLRPAHMKNLCDNVRFFREAGLEVGIWTHGLGYGGTLPPDADPAFSGMTRIRSVCDRELDEAFCPTDPQFLSWYGAWFSALCSCGASLVMVDDDLFQSVRPGLGCFCKNHRAMLAEKLQLSPEAKELSAEALKQSIFTGAPSPERTAYFQVTGDSLRAFCQKLRRIADGIDPALRLGFCAGYTSFDSEGATATELTAILAGENRPFLRLSGAPYWVSASGNRFSGTALADILEFVRMQNGFCTAAFGEEEVDLFHEADTYPRSRALVPSAICACYDCALRTEPNLGGLNYLFDYNSSPDYETGYLRGHLRYRELREQIDRAFDGTEPHGVRVIEGVRKLRFAHLPEPFAGENELMRHALTYAGGFLANLGIPTVYGAPEDDLREVPAAVCFGENARLLIGKPLPRQLILDLPAARILQQSGTDTGFASAEMIPPPLLTLHGTEQVGTGWLPFVYRLTLQDGAVPVSFFAEEQEKSPAVYRYRNGAAEFLVYAFDAYAQDPRTAFSLSYFRAEELADFLSVPYPKIRREPRFYQICRKHPDGRLVSLFLNLSADIPESIRMEGLPAKFSISGAAGVPESDGFRITSPVLPFHGFVLEQTE